MSGRPDAVGAFLDWFIDLFGWFDLADFGNNVVADLILWVTFGGAALFLLNWLRWKPARRDLLTNLKSVAGNCIGMWDRAANPDTPLNLIWSRQLFQDLSDKLHVELGKMKSASGDDERFNLYSADYWRDLTRSLPTNLEELKRSLDRAQLTLRGEPSAVSAVNELERWLGDLAKFDTFLRYLEKQSQSGDIQARYDQQLMLASVSAFKISGSAYELWKALPEIPGRAG